MPQDFNGSSRDQAALERMTRLPPLDREVLLLKTGEGVTYREIGAVLGLTPEAVEVCFASALVKLRAQLDREARR